ncbi:SDR family oxidoreductase [Nakamurella flavida]
MTGSTGYVGSRLIPALTEAGIDVLATARTPGKFARFDWADDVEPVELDVLDPDSVRAAFDGREHIDVAYYLVHAIGEGDFAEEDLEAARTFGEEAHAAGVGRIVYLGGFVPQGQELSEHLDSRRQVGEALTESGVDVVWLRAAVIVGAGSTSYELIRHLADRLPVVPIPSWMRHPVEPIAVDDVLHYLVAGADPSVPPGAYDIAGPETLPYRDLLRAYIRSAGLRRVLVPVPLVSTGLAGSVIGRIIPLPAPLVEDLIGSLQNTMVGDTSPIRSVVPDPAGGLTTMADALSRALVRTDVNRGEIAGVAGTPDPLRLAPTDPAWAGVDPRDSHHRRSVAASVDSVWTVLQGMGEKEGYFSWPLAWSVRGWLDRRAGGPGRAVHRADAEKLTVGDTLGFLTVETVDADRDGGGPYLRLTTDRWTPGEGTLEFWINPDPDPDDAGGPSSLLHIRARFLPRGVAGRVYWAVLKPFHLVIFPAMARRIAALAEH